MESLPKQFVSAMRTLFDIMDDKLTGYVKLTDIENRWREDRIKGLPRGVIESLQKVASDDGQLTFESFCTGLKICLLRNQVEGSASTSSARIESLVHSPPLNSASICQRPTHAQINNKESNERQWTYLNKTDKISRPSIISKLTSATNEEHNVTAESKIGLVLKYDAMFAPPKPPRLERPVLDERKNISLSSISISDNNNSSDIDCRMNSRASKPPGRGHGDGRPDAADETMQTQRRVSRRREPRRHTLHNGIDYNLLKRMKQIELEKEILLQGLSAVEDAREWYLKQLSEVQEKMRFAGRLGAYVEPWNEGHQERLELLRARVSELNRQLSALSASGWRQRRGPLSLHMNLVLPAPHPLADFATMQPDRTSILTTQNKMLLEEVNRKNDFITSLECEKSALIRELLSK